MKGLKLLTFLGTHPVETTYVMPDGKEYTAPFCGVALAHVLAVDQVRVFVTGEARERSLPTFLERVEGAGLEIQAVDIPGDATKEQLWETFDAVVNAVDVEERVIFDITHGFRSVSFLSFLAAAYLRVVKDIRLEGVFYGNFEARDRSVTPHRAPVIDLTALAGLLDWMMAANRFERFGDARDLAGLLRGAIPPWEVQRESREMQAQARRIRRAAGAMENVSRSLRLIRPDETMQASADLVERLGEAIPDIVRLAPPFEPLAEAVIASYRPLALAVESGDVAPREVLERERNMVQWYLERHQYIQALALAREWLISWTMLWLGREDFRDSKGRERVERAIGAALRRRREGAGARGVQEETLLGDLLTIPQVEVMLNLYDRIGQMRNDLLHAGKRPNPTPADQAERRIREWCADLSTLPLPEEM